jgi:hypothetical protein
MSRRTLFGRRPVAVAAIAMAVAVAAVVAVVLLAGQRSLPGSGARSASAGTASGADAVRIIVPPTATGPVIPAGFLGLSFEFQAVRDYTGSDPSAINPVLVELIRTLSPGQRPILRIGGDSTDDSYVPAPGVRPPGYEAYRLTPSMPA